jgi:hypothetical protein
MRVLIHLLALICIVLCSCDRSSQVKLVVGDDPTWISAEETRRVGERLIADRYPQAQVVSELGVRQTFTYRFETNGTVVPMSVVVDRKTGKARFETSSQ